MYKDIKNRTNANIAMMLIIALTAVVMTACNETEKKATLNPTEFHTEVKLGMTPVKDQGHSALCWAYAMLATIETEHIQRGDSVNLSVAYVARSFMKEQADRCYLSHGSSGITQRGTMPQLVRLIQTYGLMPYDSYHTDANMNVAERKLRSTLVAQCGRGSGLVKARQAADNVLDGSINPLPKHVYMLGMEYTPLEFAHSVCMPDEYMAFTSFTHEPMNKKVVLRLTDNYNGERFVNLPIDRLMELMEKSVRSGHPVCWEGDISERGFSFADGVADVPLAKRNCSQTMRQREFDTFRTTDDHCMAIIGIARDKEDRKYFICKNSWGTENPYGGLMYVSFDYVRLKTIAVMLNNIVLPAMEE